MSDKKITTTTPQTEINANADTGPLPVDINFEKRKQIVKEQLEKLLGKPKRTKEQQRLNNIKFAKNKTRRKIANASRRRNRV